MKKVLIIFVLIFLSFSTFIFGTFLNNEPIINKAQIRSITDISPTSLLIEKQVQEKTSQDKQVQEKTSQDNSFHHIPENVIFKEKIIKEENLKVPNKIEHPTKVIHDCISECTEITEPGYYELCGDIDASYLVEYYAVCIDILSDNVEIDGKGYLMTGRISGRPEAIRIRNRNYVSIHNVDTIFFSEVIGIFNSSNIHVYNNFFNEPGDGIMLAGRNNVIENNTILDGFCGINVIGESNNITNNVILKHTYGIYIYGVNNSYVFNNTVIDNRYGAIFLTHGASNNVISDNYITSRGQYTGIKIRFSSNNNTIKNNVIDNNYHGITISHESNYNNITNNSIKNNNRTGIILSDLVEGNNIISNDIQNNTNGILMDLIARSVFKNNIINRNKENGIYCGRGTYNIFEENIVCFNNKSGDGLYTDVYNELISYTNVWVGNTCRSSFPSDLCENICLQVTPESRKTLKPGSFDSSAFGSTTIKE
ncbi:right-handed parallel beta-helix repeat-containing protein [Candidatus Micrarchaeota archaeon]|nr:right-handed parallel beta-helix repeat-containing protein [Candidatus Micrarchaeota archaeon]